MNPLNSSELKALVEADSQASFCLWMMHRAAPDQYGRETQARRDEIALCISRALAELTRARDLIDGK